MVKTVSKRYYFIVDANTLLHFYIVMHVHLVLFVCHKFFMKLITFLFLKVTAEETPESNRPFKIQVKSRLTLSKLYLLWQFFAKKEFWLKTKLCNIFRSINATKMPRPVLESTYNTSITKRSVWNVTTALAIFACCLFFLAVLTFKML